MSIREELADLEHQQWAHWTRYMLNNLTPENIERWLRQVDTPYTSLSEQEKESDQRWADKVLKIMTQHSNEELPANHTPPAKEGAPARPQDGTGFPSIKELIEDVKQVANDVKDMFKGE